MPLEIALHRLHVGARLGQRAKVHRSQLLQALRDVVGRDRKRVLASQKVLCRLARARSQRRVEEPEARRGVEA